MRRSAPRRRPRPRGRRRWSRPRAPRRARRYPPGAGGGPDMFVTDTTDTPTAAEKQTVKFGSVRAGAGGLEHGKVNGVLSTVIPVTGTGLYGPLCCSSTTICVAEPVVVI